MIDLIFYYGQEIVLIRVNGHTVTFASGSNGNKQSTIDGLKLSKVGAIKEHPDLKDDEQWKEKTIERFKEKIKSLNSEMERVKYIIDDLKKFGYIPRYIQRAGHRPMKIK